MTVATQSTLEKFRNFQPAGPVAASFLNDSTAKVRAILGPVGGGKTVSCIFDCLKNASAMPVCVDGIIRYRVAVIGSTYGQLERNLYPSWLDWLPKDGGDWTEGVWEGGGGRFARHKIEFDVIRNGQRVPVHFEAIFAAIGDQNVEQFMRGFEPTAFWLYEMDQLPEGVLTNAIGRIGRYPAKRMLPPGATFRRYVIGDLNAPDIDSWFYRLFEENRPAGFELYKQPSGRSPLAENLHNLPPGYYDDQVELNKHKPRWITRFVDAKYGPSEDGEPVYPEYSDAIHLAPEPLRVIKGRGLLLGFDQGLTMPACVISQRAPSGQLRCLAEVVPGRMNGRRFARQVAQVLGEVAPGERINGAWSDPAGYTGADKEAGELAWAEIVSHELQIPIQPAPTNEIDPRLTAVKDELTFMIDPHTPGILISPTTCPMLRKGFASHYRYKRQRVGNTDRFSDKPEKNAWSNPQDALQYQVLGEKGRAGVIAGPKGSSRPGWNTGSNTQIKSDFVSGGW